MRESIDFMEKEKEIRQNPFFLDYDTPHATVPFDRIRFEDYEEAFMEGIRRDKEEIEKTVNDPEEPTFENTIARVDTSKGPHYYDLLDRVSKVFSNMLNAETNDDLDDLAQKMSPILTQHENDIMLNRPLFERIKKVYDSYFGNDSSQATLNPETLTPEQEMLLRNCYAGFVRSGAPRRKATRRTARNGSRSSGTNGEGARQGRLDFHARRTLVLALYDLFHAARTASADVYGEKHGLSARQRRKQPQNLPTAHQSAARNGATFGL